MAQKHKPWRPMTLLMTTMCPERLFFMSGITSLIMRTTPKKLVSNTSFISSMLMLSTGPSKPTPALLTGGKQTCYHLQLCRRPWDQLQMWPPGVSLWQPREDRGQNGSWWRLSGSGVISPGRTSVQQGFLSYQVGSCFSPGINLIFCEIRNPCWAAGLAGPGWWALSGWLAGGKWSVRYAGSSRELFN